MNTKVNCICHHFLHLYFNGSKKVGAQDGKFAKIIDTNQLGLNGYNLEMLHARTET